MNSENNAFNNAGSDIIVENEVITEKKPTRLKITSLKPYAYMLWAFFIPAVIFTAIYAIMKVFPIGENSVLVLDLNGQYVYFFEYLRDFFQGDTSIVYSWSRALGGEFIGILAYYLASPFSFIVALFPEGMITESLFAMFILKCGLSGLTFCIYLHNTERVCSKSARIIFSIMYALMAYAVVNAHNTMWIDALIFLPLIILGVEKLISERKYLLYTITLTIAIIANFYIGYMLCIFIAVYFFYYYFAFSEKNKNNLCAENMHFLRSLGRMALFTFIVILISSIILFPTYYSLTFGKTSFSDPQYAFAQKFDFLDLFVKALPGSYDTVRPEGFPFIYCGMLALILLPVYFISKGISPREKIFSGLILSVFVFSFNISVVDMFWHGMQNPNWLNYRYSFIFCFFMILFAFRAFIQIEKSDFKNIIAVCGIMLLLILVVQKLDYNNAQDMTCIWLSIVLIGVYIIILYTIKAGWVKSVSVLILAIIVSAEMLSAGLLHTLSLGDDVTFSSRTSYVSFIEKFQPLFDYIKDYDPSFYRAEKTEHRKTNDPMTLGFNGLSNSTSTLNSSTIKFLNQLGYSSKSHWTKYLGGTPVSDSLLGIKYLVTVDNYDGYYSEIYKNENYKIYQNPYALSLCLAVNDSYGDLDFSAYNTPFDLMNAMVTAMLGSEEEIQIFKPLPVNNTVYTNCEMTYVADYYKYEPRDSSAGDARVIFTMNAKTDDEIFLFLPSEYPREVSMTINGRNIGTFFANETDRIQSIGYYKDGDILNLGITLKTNDLYILTNEHLMYCLDKDLFDEVMPLLRQNMYNIESFSDTRFKGTINVPENRTLLYTSIPYDAGWHFICDGVEIAPFEVGNALIAVNLPAGQHELEIYYFSNPMLYGIICCILGILLFAFVILVDVLFIRKRRRNIVLENGGELQPIDIDLDPLPNIRSDETASGEISPPADNIENGTNTEKCDSQEIDNSEKTDNTTGKDTNQI